MSVHRLQSSSSCVADDEPPSEFAIKHVVKCLLKQHHQYTEEELCEYLSSNFPEIPKSYHSTVVSAASAAAKYVSSVALVADTLRCSPDLGKSRLAESARHSLVIWNFGLQQNSSSVRDSDIPSLTQLTNRDVMVATGASSHSTVRAEPSIAISTWSRGATSSCVVGDDNIISDPSHSTTRAESSIAPSALGVQQRSDSNGDRVNPPDSPQSNPNSGLTVVDAEPEVKCSQDLVPDTQSSAESQVEPEQLAELTQVAAIKQADVKQSELEESQFQEQSGCAGASQHRSSRKSRSSDRAVELSVEEYADFKQFRKSRRLERR